MGPETDVFGRPVERPDSLERRVLELDHAHAVQIARDLASEGGAQDSASICDLLGQTRDLHATELDTELAAIQEAMLRGFFRRAAGGKPFCPIEDCGRDLGAHCPNASATYRRFSSVFWTLNTIVTVLDIRHPQLVATQLLKGVEGRIRNLFFPLMRTIPAHYRVAQREMIAKYGAQIDPDDLFYGGDVKASPRAGCLATLVIMCSGLVHAVLRILFSV